jgi:hypothetical protein
VWYAYCALQLKRVSVQRGLLQAQQTLNSKYHPSIMCPSYIVIVLVAEGDADGSADDYCDLSLKLDS